MRFGINSFLYTSPFTTESVKLFPKFKKWGFETVEIPVEAPEHIDPAKVKAAGQAIQKTYVRYVDGKPVPHTVKNADPMKFTSAVMGSGPSTAYPETQISGSIDWGSSAH